MTTLQAIILGIVQGLTEFLPISSSGHLVIFEYFFGILKSGLLFEVLIHLATLLAVIIYFRKTLLKLRFYELFILGIGTLPAVIFSLLFKDYIEKAFSSIWHIVFEISITGALLLIAQRKLSQNPETEEVVINLKKITPLQAFIIGCWQAVAILPAISRSGATVVGALLLGIDRQTAFTFSFLLSIPAILGAAVLELSDLSSLSTLTNSDLINYSLAFVFSFLFGILSLRWFQYVIRKTQLHYFAYYCFAVALLLGGYLLLK